MSGSDHSQIWLDVKGGGEEDFTRIVDGFKKDRGIRFVLAFSGGADDSNPLLRHTVSNFLKDTAIEKDEPVANTESDEHKESVKKLTERANKDYVSEIVREILQPLQGFHIGVLTGGTVWGVPGVAMEIAHELGFPTIGVFPLRASLKKKNMLPKESVNLAICVHPFVGTSQWGDESAIYTKLLDAVIIIGGNAGTMVEVAHLLKQNEGKEQHEIKHLIPVYGTGGTADKVSFFPGKPETMARCVPSLPMTNGTEALQYLKKISFTDDVYD